MANLFQGKVNLNTMTKCSGAILRTLSEHPQKKSWVIAVNGNLGAGKTTMFQAFIKDCHDQLDASLDASSYIQSPTFTYLKTYEGQMASLWHVDAYRLSAGLWTEILNVWAEDMSPRNHILWVEWYDKIANSKSQFSPDIAIDIRFPEGAAPLYRLITIRANSSFEPSVTI